MIKKKHYLVFISGLILITYFIWNKTREDQSVNNIKNENQAYQIQGKKIIGLTPGKEQEETKKLKVANSPSPNWKKGLRSLLLAQSKNSLKDIELKTIDSFIWVFDGIPLHVESVLVSIKNEDNAVTKFKVIVDAESGKILRNWDQPIYDPINPRQNFSIKPDPRHYGGN